MQSNIVHLVTLSGGGDTFRKLVSPEVWAWINAPYVKTSDGHEVLPEAVKKEMVKYSGSAPEKMHITSGSYDNDRAMNAPGPEFDSTEEVMDYLEENSLVLAEEEYEGYCY